MKQFSILGYALVDDLYIEASDAALKACMTVSNVQIDIIEDLRAEMARLRSREGWTKEMGFILDGANQDELAAYDYGCVEGANAVEKLQANNALLRNELAILKCSLGALLAKTEP